MHRWSDVHRKYQDLLYSFRKIHHVVEKWAFPAGFSVCVNFNKAENYLDVIYFSYFLGDWIKLDPYTSTVRINPAVWSYWSVFVVFLHIFYYFLSKYNFWHDCFVTGRSTVEGQGEKKGHVSLLYMTPPWLRIFLLIYVTRFLFWIIFQRHFSTQEFCVRTFFSSFFPVIFSLYCFTVTCRNLTC